MKRRWLPSLPIKKNCKGGFATKWEGWEKAWIRSYVRLERELTRWNLRNIDNIYDIPDICGVYVFLNKDKYVLYVGKSKNLSREIWQKLNQFSNSFRNYISYVCAHQAINNEEALKMESDLLGYYTPPWNTRYHR